MFIQKYCCNVSNKSKIKNKNISLNKIKFNLFITYYLCSLKHFPY